MGITEGAIEGFLEGAFDGDEVVLANIVAALVEGRGRRHNKNNIKITTLLPVKRERKAALAILHL